LLKRVFRKSTIVVLIQIRPEPVKKNETIQKGCPPEPKKKTKTRGEVSRKKINKLPIQRKKNRK